MFSTTQPGLAQMLRTNRRVRWRSGTTSKLYAVALLCMAASGAGCISLHPRTLPGECTEGWWKHVVSPGHLVVYEPCLTVRGTVLYKDHGLDGDIDIVIRLDAAFTDLPNVHQVGHHAQGTLVLEMICRSPVWRIAQPACWGCRNRMPIPDVGDHIEVDGSYVLDKRHGWMEIHPVTRITVLGPQSGNPDAR